MVLENVAIGTILYGMNFKYDIRYTEHATNVTTSARFIADCLTAACTAPDQPWLQPIHNIRFILGQSVRIQAQNRIHIWI